MCRHGKRLQQLASDQRKLSVGVMQGYGGQQQHVLVGHQYVVQGYQPTVLILKEKNISMGTDSDVTNQHGQVGMSIGQVGMSICRNTRCYLLQDLIIYQLRTWESYGE
jgi:hypothetical protein